jgi:hypothetical protein
MRTEQLAVAVQHAGFGNEPDEFPRNLHDRQIPRAGFVELFDYAHHAVKVADHDGRHLHQAAYF